MKNGGENSIEIDEGKEVIEIKAYGSWVYKLHIREALSLQWSYQYREEIEILCKDVEGFKEMYEDNSQRHRVRVEVAKIILQTILSRALDSPPDIKFRYTS